MTILPDSLVMRPMTPSEVPAFADLVERTFGGPRLTDAEIVNRRGVLEPPRTLVVFDNDELIATLATHSLTMSVPGGELPVGGVNHVAVRADLTADLAKPADYCLGAVVHAGDPVGVVGGNDDQRARHGI